MYLFSRDHHWETDKRRNCTPLCQYLTIIPRARMVSESIAHEAEGRMGY